MASLLGMECRLLYSLKQTYDYNRQRREDKLDLRGETLVVPDSLTEEQQVLDLEEVRTY
jgi:hypothetical protein